MTAHYPTQHAREMLAHYAELAEKECHLDLALVDERMIALWSAVEAARASGAMDEDRFERFEMLALEEGLADPPRRPSPIMDGADARASLTADAQV